MEDLSSRLRSALDHHGKSQAWLARQVGVERASVNAWVKGDTKNLKMAYLFAAARALEVRAEWLALGEGPREAPPVPPGAEKLLELFARMDDERQQETLAFAKYARSISFTGDHEQRSRAQQALVSKTPRLHEPEPPPYRKGKSR